jgi:hypothetical protein
VRIRLYNRNTFHPDREAGKKTSYSVRPGSSFPAITSFPKNYIRREQVVSNESTIRFKQKLGQLRTILEDSASTNMSLVLAQSNDPDNVAATLQEVTRLHSQKLSKGTNAGKKDQIIIVVPSEVPHAFTEQLPQIQEYIAGLNSIVGAQSEIRLLKTDQLELHKILLEARDKQTTVTVSNLDDPGLNNMTRFILENSLKSSTLEKVDRYSASNLAKELNIKYVLVADHHEDQELILHGMIKEIVDAGSDRQGWSLDSHAAAVSLDAMVWYEKSIRQLKESSEELYSKLMEFVQAGVNTDLFYGFLGQDSNNKKYESKHPIGRFFSALYKYPWLIKALGLEENLAPHKQDKLLKNKRVPILEERNSILKLIRTRAKEHVQKVDEEIDKDLARIFFQNSTLEFQTSFPFTEIVAQSYAYQILTSNPIVGKWQDQKFLLNIVHPPLPITALDNTKNSISDTLKRAYSENISSQDIRRTIGRIIERAHKLIHQQIEMKQPNRSILDIFKLANKMSFSTMFKIFTLANKSNNQVLGDYFKILDEYMRYSQLVSLPSLTVAITDVGGGQVLASGRKGIYIANQERVEEFHVGNFLAETTGNIIGGNHNQGAATIDLSNRETLQVMKDVISKSILCGHITENTTDSELVELFLRACLLKQNKTHGLESELSQIQNSGILPAATKNY